jgi:hypothetical protein
MKSILDHVPEPGTRLMPGIGLLALVAGRRRFAR